MLTLSVIYYTIFKEETNDYLLFINFKYDKHLVFKITLNLKHK